MSKTRSVDQLKRGDLLTKMECCALFCDKLRISRDSYYNYIRPKLTFKNVMEDLTGYGEKSPGIERIPYTIAIGIIHKMMNNKQPDDPPGYELNEYIDRF